MRFLKEDSDLMLTRLQQKHIPDTLVDDDTKSMLSDVEDTSSTTVVGLVRHTLVEGTITLDGHDISAFVSAVESSEVFRSVLPETFGEHVAGTATITFRVCHLDLLPGKKTVQNSE